MAMVDRYSQLIQARVNPLLKPLSVRRRRRPCFLVRTFHGACSVSGLSREIQTVHVGFYVSFDGAARDIWLRYVHVSYHMG